jgi:hypothetical protein
MKIKLFFTFGFDNWLHKGALPRIDAISKEVSVVLLAAICCKLHPRTFIQCYACHGWGTLKNVDIIARTEHPKKKACQI